MRNAFQMNNHGWKDGLYDHTLKHLFVSSGTCQTTNQHSNQSNVKLNNIPIMFLGCTGLRATFANKRSFRSWSQHYAKYHPTNSKYLQITQQQSCTQSQCANIIPLTRTHCLLHQLQHQDNSNNDNTPTISPPPTIPLNGHAILDADQQPFDVYRTMQYIKCDEHVTH